ncbi:CLUMA_CG012487, isoform A [Clunio marinus]|uniref:CLUMA_CG012487, isoform A n=1 Tax=Clunio marinus TaxID=568069 RepID=A0A1J1IJD9_9DIPT|nr:CLUMA_CG012487, isoform A [Clunio marinus]
MGNLLCKDSSKRVKTPKKGYRAPVNSVYGKQEIHPNSLTSADGPSPKIFNETRSNFFHSTPNLNEGQKLSTISLDAKIFDNGEYKSPPIAPPRKKRTSDNKRSTLPTDFGSDKVVRNGFKDVFTGGKKKSLTFEDIEYIDKDEDVLQTRVSTSPERKLHVGNKKTDKFFGEDLSEHLSDEHINETKETTNNETNEEFDLNSTSEKKLFFLMNMLDHDQLNNDQYLNMIPKETTPEKSEDKQLRIKRIISRDELPSPPATPQRKSGTPSTPTITIETFEFNTTANNDNNSSKITETKVEVKKEISPERTTSIHHKINHDDDQLPKEDHASSASGNTIMTHGFVDHILSKAYGFQGYNPEEHEHLHDDGSNLVTPTSKLAVRKISVGRKVSTTSNPSLDGDLTKLNELLSPGTPTRKLSTDEAEPDRGTPTSPMKNRDFQKLLSNVSMEDIIDEIYSKNSAVMQEFQSYLESSIETDPVIDVAEEKKFVETKEITDREFIQTPEPTKLPERNVEAEDNLYSDSFESSDTEQEIINDMSNVFKKVGTRRRESIEDVDGWFNNHLDLEEKKSQLCGPRENLHSNLSTYDQEKVFPFGRTIVERRESTSDEFFEPASINSSICVDQTLRDSKNSISEDVESSNIVASPRSSKSPESNDDKVETKPRVTPSPRSSKSPDHSTLLKFLDHESKSEIF